MDKYRIKLNSGRVLGPVSKEEIGELYIKGFIKGEEYFQTFPSGDWKALENFDEIQNLILDIISNKISENSLQKAAISKKINAVDSMATQTKEGDEFTEKFGLKASEPTKELQKSEFVEFKANKQNSLDLDVSLEKDERTAVKKRDSQSADKTILKELSAEERAEVDALKNKLNHNEKIEEDSQKESTKSEDVDFENESTVVVNLGELLPELKDDFKKTEKEQLEREGKEKTEVRKEVKHKTKKKDVNKKILRKSKITPIAAFAIAILFYLTFVDEDPSSKKFTPAYPQIVFPQPLQVEDPEKSLEASKKGREFYEFGTYLAKIESAKWFRKSLEYKFKKNPDLGNLILVYSELYPFTQSPISSAQKIYDLVKIGKYGLLNDLKIVMGVSQFYLSLEKHRAGIKIVEDFLRTNNKPSPKLFSIYLNLALGEGDFVKAKKIYEKMGAISRKSVDVWRSMINYQLSDSNYNEAKKLVSNAIESFPNSVPLYLQLAKILIYFEDIKPLAKVLERIKKLDFEKNAVHYSQSLEYFGTLAGYKGDYEKAVKFYKLALKINESEALRARLSALELGGSKETESIILESKVFDLMKKSRKAARENRWDTAFKFALEASELDPKNISAKILYADILQKRGFFNRSIEILSRLEELYPKNEKIKFKLIEVYIEAFKLEKAKTILLKLRDTKWKNHFKYSSLFGRYYWKTGNLALSYKWLTDSLNKNPLHDPDAALLAKALVANGKYEKAKFIIRKAIDIDPANTEYRSIYGNILYEFDSAEVAIGYIRDVLKDSKDDPRLLGDIAIYYYKSGQIKAFENEKEMIEKLPTRDPNLYRLLIRSSKLERKPDKVIQYYNELLKIAPGDMQSRMGFGEYLGEIGRIDDALREFEEVKKRLDTYPLLHYNIAKVYYLKADYESAKKFAEKEIEITPYLEHGYTILGKALLKLNDFPKSIQNLRKALSINRKSLEATLSMAYIKHKQNHVDEALNLYLFALNEDPDNPEIHKQLGYLYRDTGQGALAIESFQVYLNLNPGAADKSQVEAIVNSLK